jgi:hypothetical protein
MEFDSFFHNNNTHTTNPLGLFGSPAPTVEHTESQPLDILLANHNHNFQHGPFCSSPNENSDSTQLSSKNGQMRLLSVASSGSGVSSSRRLPVETTGT